MTFLFCFDVESLDPTSTHKQSNRLQVCWCLDSIYPTTTTVHQSMIDYYAKGHLVDPCATQTNWRCLSYSASGSSPLSKSYAFVLFALLIRLGPALTRRSAPSSSSHKIDSWINQAFECMAASTTSSTSSASWSIGSFWRCRRIIGTAWSAQRCRPSENLRNRFPGVTNSGSFGESGPSRRQLGSGLSAAAINLWHPLINFMVVIIIATNYSQLASVPDQCSANPVPENPPTGRCLPRQRCRWRRQIQTAAWRYLQ